jgi:hypothetical protein
VKISKYIISKEQNIVRENKIFFGIDALPSSLIDLG